MKVQNINIKTQNITKETFAGTFNLKIKNFTKGNSF